MKIKFDEKQLVILGIGGHARSVADVALQLGYLNIIFVDKNAKNGECYEGFEVFKRIPNSINLSKCVFFPAAGDNSIREEQYKELKKMGVEIVSIISNRATISRDSTIQAAVFIGHHAHVGPRTTIRDAVILNTSSIVEHDSIIGNFSHVSIGTAVAGSCTVGDRCFLGAASTIIDSIEITENVTLGAGGVVIKNIKDSGVYVGVPAKMVTRL